MRGRAIWFRLTAEFASNLGSSKNAGACKRCGDFRIFDKRQAVAIFASMSKKSVKVGSQTRSARDGSYVLVGRDAKAGTSSTVVSQNNALPKRGRDVAKSATAIKPVPLDPDAFMDYLLEEDAVIMEHLAK